MTITTVASAITEVASACIANTSESNTRVRRKLAESLVLPSR
jgi:hypothetical protein